MTGLLCFYTEDAVTEILGKVVPAGPLQYHQEGGKVDFQGPIRTSLKEAVVAVAKEEDNNMFRDYLHAAVARKTSDLFEQADDVNQAWSVKHVLEAPIVVGMLRWMVTPAYKRYVTDGAVRVYPTRSLHAWTLAVAMS